MMVCIQIRDAMSDVRVEMDGVWGWHLRGFVRLLRAITPFD